MRQSLPVLSSPQPLVITNDSVSMDLSSLDISRKWNYQYSIGRFCVLNLSPNLMFFEVHLCCGKYQFSVPFLSLNYSPL